MKTLAQLAGIFHFRCHISKWCQAYAMLAGQRSCNGKRHQLAGWKCKFNAQCRVEKHIPFRIFGAWQQVVPMKWHHLNSCMTHIAPQRTNVAAASAFWLLPHQTIWPTAQRSSGGSLAFASCFINKAIYCINSHCTWSFGWPQLWPQVQSISYILGQKLLVHNRLNLALKFVSRANCNFCRTSFETHEWATTWCLWHEHVLFSHVEAATRHFLLIVVPHLADC